MSAWPWPSSDATNKVVTALVGALQSVADVTKDKKVNAGQMSYTYADLADVLAAAKPVLAKHGLSITQAASNDGVQTVVMHETGEWLSYPPLAVRTGQNTPQAQGSALTYARRYSLLAALNIATEDDDGQAAAVPAPKPVETAAEREAKKLIDRLRALPEPLRNELRPKLNGRAVSVAELAGDADWREQVAAWADEVEQAVAS